MQNKSFHLFICNHCFLWDSVMANTELEKHDFDLKFGPCPSRGVCTQRLKSLCLHVWISDRNDLLLQRNYRTNRPKWAVRRRWWNAVPCVVLVGVTEAGFPGLYHITYRCIVLKHFSCTLKDSNHIKNTNPLQWVLLILHVIAHLLIWYTLGVCPATHKRLCVNDPSAQCKVHLSA